MIAVLKLTLGGQRHYATLADDGTWHCRACGLLETMLNVHCDPHEEDGPEHGPFGGKAVQRALQRFQPSKVVWRLEPDGVPRIY